MNRAVLIWGYLASFLLLLGAIFMNLNFVAGKVLYLIGFFAFNLGYLIPLFYVIFKRNQENNIGLVILSGVLGFLAFLTGVSFFVVNWGGGIVLIYTGGGILILAILLIIIFSRRFYETHIDSWFPVLIFGVFIVVSLLTGMVHRQVMRVFSLHNKDALEILHAVEQKNNAIYAQLAIIDTSKQVAMQEVLHKVDQLKKESKILTEFIGDLKASLIYNVEDDAYSAFDGDAFDNLVPIQSNVEINSVHRYMFKGDTARATKLKYALETYKNNVVGLIEEEEGWLSNYVNTNLRTEKYELQNRKFNRSWEYQNFYDLPLITVVNQLTQLQWKVSLVEGEVLNHFYTLTLRVENGSDVKNDD